MANVKHRVGIKGHIEAVFQKLATSDGLAAWWASSASGEAVVGSRIDLTFTGLAVLEFEFTEIQANKTVCLNCVSGPGPWQGSSLIFKLEESDGQVMLTLIHRNSNATEEDFLYFNTKWPVYLLSLKDLVEKGRGRPYPDDIKIHFGD